MEIEFLAFNTFARRPRGPLLPFVRAGFKRYRSARGQASLVFQPVREPRGLYVLAEILSRIAAEFHVSELVSRPTCPAAVIPRTHGEIVVVLRVVLFQ